MFGKKKKTQEPSLLAMLAMLQDSGAKLSKEEIVTLLQTTPQAFKAFEQAYQNAQKNTKEKDVLDMNAKEASSELHALRRDEAVTCDTIIDTIVNELLAQTAFYHYDGTKATESFELLPVKEPEQMITKEQIQKLPPNERPQLTGTLYQRDFSLDSSAHVLWYLKEMMETSDEKQKRFFYHHFRQGLDILDLDPLLYAILGQNRNSMGHWLPALVKANNQSGNFFQIPRTTIAQVPLSLLQLSRLDYGSLNKTTLQIVDRWAMQAFDLQLDGDYFIKTGTYSSKFDFRNCRVHEPKEVKELGEYLLFIQFQASSMASPLASPSIYGMSTTREWVVRSFIPDKEQRPCIYHGLPLRCEYRVFVDCDSKQVLGIHPYWDPAVMKKRFDSHQDPDSLHDAITYRMEENKLLERYEQNKEQVVKQIQRLLPHLSLHGQWSIDVMEDQEDLWLIDMAVAENSAFYQDSVPRALRRPTPENWIPHLPENKKE